MCRETDKYSMGLLTTSLHRQLFQYTGLLYCTKRAPASFQQIMGKMLAGSARAAAYLNDSMVMNSKPDEFLRRFGIVPSGIQGFQIFSSCASWSTSVSPLTRTILDQTYQISDSSDTSRPIGASILRSSLGLRKSTLSTLS